jgi:hypothetical protein
VGSPCVLIDLKVAKIVAWTLAKHKCGLFITLQQLMMEVEKITLIRFTPLQNEIPLNSR